MSKRDVPHHLSAELLSSPAPLAVRVVAVAQLDDVLTGYRRIEEDAPEALHDLRVSMRRLRSWLRAFRSDVSDTLRGRTRRQLKALAAATNQARDAEVALQWLATQEDLPARHLVGYRSIMQSLERERDLATRRVRDTLDRDLSHLVDTLRRRLAFYWERRRIDEPAPSRTMAEVFARAIDAQAEELELALRRAAAADDAREAHRARIAAKRLRYLLEPVMEDPAAQDVVKRLQSLQQRLGDIRDANRIAMRIVREIGECSARDARQRALAAIESGSSTVEGEASFARLQPGLLELTRRAHAAEVDALSRYRAEWRKRDIAGLMKITRDIGERLSPR